MRCLPGLHHAVFFIIEDEGLQFWHFYVPPLILWVTCLPFLCRFKLCERVFPFLICDVTRGMFSFSLVNIKKSVNTKKSIKVISNKKLFQCWMELRRDTICNVNVNFLLFLICSYFEVRCVFASLLFVIIFVMMNDKHDNKEQKVKTQQTGIKLTNFLLISTIVLFQHNIWAT